MSNGEIRVLVVDDNHVVRMGLTMLLDAEPDLCVVGEAGDGQSCVDAVAELRPDVVVLDVRMPGSFDGTVAAAQVSGTSKVLMLSYAEDRLVVQQALASGARGYLVHGDAAPEEIVTAVRTVHAGQLYFSSRAGDALVGLLPVPEPSPTAAPAATAERTGGHRGLTRREVEIMDLLATGRPNPQIARELYMSPSTLKNHITRIFDKLGVRTRAEAIVLWLDSQSA